MHSGITRVCDEIADCRNVRMVVDSFLSLVAAFVAGFILGQIAGESVRKPTINRKVDGVFSQGASANGDTFISQRSGLSSGTGWTSGLCQTWREWTVRKRVDLDRTLD